MAEDQVSKQHKVVPKYQRLSAVDAVLRSPHLTPSEKMDTLKDWDVSNGQVGTSGYRRIASAAALGLSNPAPYSTKVQRAIIELYHLHPKELPDPWQDHWPDRDTAKPRNRQNE